MEDTKFELKLVKNANFMHEILGITDDRCGELMELADKAHNSNELFTNAYKEIIESCKNINEVVLIINIFNQIHKIKENDDLMGFLTNIIGNDRN
jgi:hypothetical protein